jgi:DNA-binding CsgD family transcriptional regulator
MRFLAAKKHLTEAELRYLTDIDHHDHEALAVFDPGPSRSAPPRRRKHMLARPRPSDSRPRGAGGHCPRQAAYRRITAASLRLPRAEAGRPTQGVARRPEAGLWALLPRTHARHALRQLTGRQRDVLALMAEGHSNTAIATRLFVTEHTVEKHVKNIFATLRLTPSPEDHRRVLAVLAFLQASYPPSAH